MHIIVLPSGNQRSLRGNIINVPADIYETVHLLPQYINDTGTVTVKLKRKLQYRSVYQESNIRPEKDLRALQYSLQNSPYYRTTAVGLDDNWLESAIRELENSGNLEVELETVIPERTHINTIQPNDEVANSEESSNNESDNFSEGDTEHISVVHDTLLDIIPEEHCSRTRANTIVSST